MDARAYTGRTRAYMPLDPTGRGAVAGRMHFGVVMFPTDYAMRVDDLARAVEARGFESLWFPEHTHIPVSRRSPWPGGPTLPKEYWHTHELFVALATAAAVTTTLKVGSGICLLVERDPITTAKEVASLDFLSRGRVLFGVGGGWNAEEMEDHGTDFKQRWRVLRERVLAMKRIWTEDEAAFEGDFVRFEPLWSWPKPVQKPHPPILLGGHGPRAQARARHRLERGHRRRRRLGRIDRVKTLRLLESMRDVPRAAWDALVGDGSPFLEWEWLAVLEDSGAATAATGWLPRFLTLWEGERLVGACPLYVKGHSLGEFVFDQNWAAAAARAGIAYYPKLLVAVPFTPVTGARFLAAPGAERGEVIATLAAALEATCGESHLSSAHVNFCLPDEAAALEARGWLARTGWQYHWTNPGFASFEDYLASLRSKRRNQVRRERRELAAEGVEIVSYAGDGIPDTLFPRMFTLYRRTIDQLPWGQQYLDESFFTLARERLRARLVFVVAHQDGEAIAGTFNVAKGDTLYGRYWGAERVLRHLHFNVCYYAGIEHCIAHGLRRFEPGAGGEFKLWRGFDPTATASLHWLRDPRLAAAVRKFLVQEPRPAAREIGWLGERSALRRDRGGPGDGA